MAVNRKESDRKYHLKHKDEDWYKELRKKHIDNWKAKNKDYINEYNKNLRRIRVSQAIKLLDGKCYICNDVREKFEFHHIKYAENSFKTNTYK